MTESMSQQQAAAFAADPATSAEQLAHLAAQHRELWPQIAAHPNAYEGLVDWMRQQGFDPSTAAQQLPTALPQQPQQPAYPAQAPAQQTYAYTEQPVPGQPMQVGTPGFPGFPGAQPFGGPAAPPSKRRTGWIIGGIAGALVIALIAVLAVFVFVPKGGGGSFEAQLAALEAEDEFSLQIFDIGNLEQAIGEKFPKNGTEAEIEDWFDEVVDDDRISWSAYPDPLTTVLAEAGGGVVLYSGDSMTGALPGSVSKQRIDELFDDEGDDVWFSDEVYLSRGDGAWLARVDGTLYFAEDEDALPDEKPERADSFAADAEVMRVLQRLQKAGGYSYSLTRFDHYAESMLGLEDAASISLMGSALGANDEGAVSTRVFAHDSSDDAGDNLDLIREFYQDMIDDADIDIEFEVKQEGALIVVTSTAKDLDEFNSYFY